MTDPLKACQAHVAELEANARAVARAHMDQVAALSERVASLDTALDASKEAHFREQDDARKLVAENTRLTVALRDSTACWLDQRDKLAAAIATNASILSLLPRLIDLSYSYGEEKPTIGQRPALCNGCGYTAIWTGERWQSLSGHERGCVVGEAEARVTGTPR